MIVRSDLTDIGTFNQPHGIKGEINATVDPGIDLQDLRCIVVDVDGIYVPFFVGGVRPRSATTLLVTLYDVTDEHEASTFQGKTIYALRKEVADDTEDEEGFYADELAGFSISDETGELNGIIEEIDDSTENLLFVVKTNEGNRVLIPVAEEFITEVDPDTRHITVDLPQGLLDI